MADLICHLVWMPEYCGEDDIEGAGFAYVAETGKAHEIRNFEKDPETGSVLGYVQTRTGTINITRLGAKDNAESIGGVRVIFTATNPRDKERYVVGYYLNATVFRNRQPGVRAIPTEPAEMINHSIEVDAENAILVPVEKRSLLVPHHDGKGLPGQTIVFYPNESDRPEMSRFLNDFNRFVATTPTRRARQTSKSASKKSEALTAGGDGEGNALVGAGKPGTYRPGPTPGAGQYTVVKEERQDWYIYVLELSNKKAVKVGISSDPQSRLNEYNRKVLTEITGLSWTLAFTHHVTDARIAEQVEQAVLSTFSDRQLESNGEVLKGVDAMTAQLEIIRQSSA